MIRKNHLFQLEGAYSDHPVQLPDCFRADQELNRVVKGMVQMPLKHWLPRGTGHLSKEACFVV